MNGLMVKEYDRKQFGKDAVAFCDGNKKVNGVAMKLYGKLKAMDNKQMERFKALNTTQEEVCGNLQKYRHFLNLEGFLKDF